MAQSSLQTQCPKCRTRFRVTDEQLGIAKGKVRCGHCMDVFNAVEHQLAGGGTSNAPATPPGTGSRAPADASRPEPSPPEHSPPGHSATGFTSDIIEDDFVFADNPEEDAEEGRYTGTRLTFSDDELSDSFRGFDDRDSSARDELGGDDPVENVDESWAEAILQEDSAPVKTTPETEKAEVEAEPESELQQEPSPEPEKSSAATAAENLQEQPQEEASDFYVDEQRDEPFTASAPFGDLRRDPVSVGSNNRSWLRALVWSLIVLGLMGVLIAQATWYQFDRLSAIPELRPLYETGCELADCELKPLIDVSAIQSRKLVVRTDPENRSQLIVDAVIINRADFQQPFPAIALTFSNLNGDIVAQSVFIPSEYLAGDAEELETMPVETPVRIALSIRDPGRDAVNYNISFRPYMP